VVKMTRQSKKYRTQKVKSDLQLIYDRKEEYNHLISIGYTKDQAILKLRNSPPLNSLTKLKLRYQQSHKAVGTSGISMKGIQRTKDVEKFIVHHHLIDMGDTLYFPKNKQLGRTSPISIVGTSHKESTRIRTVPFDFSSTTRPQFVGGKLTISKSVLEEAEERRKAKRLV